MAPIRVGIIGLSTSAKTSWASIAHLPYLKAYPEKYVVTAICNSSVESANKAVIHYQLPSSTKAYGDVHDIAKDPAVDLVVCCTRVDMHYSTIRPSIEAGKDVYVEWPLAANVESARDLAHLARQKGVRTMVGLQGQQSPIASTVKRLLASGSIGRPLSSSIFASGGTRRRDAMPETLSYFSDKDVGGNMVTIGYAHMIDTIHHTFQSEFATLNAHLRILRPKVPITGTSNDVIDTVTTNVPDWIALDGTLASHDIPLDIVFRRGEPFKGHYGFEWLVSGELGEIKVSGPGPIMHVAVGSHRIEVYDFAKEEVEDISYGDEYEDLPVPARNVGRLYDLFAKGDAKTYPDFDHAVRRHQEIESMYSSSDGGMKPVSYV